MTTATTDPRPGAQRRRSTPPALAAATGAAWAAGVGLVAVAVVVLLAWSAETRSGSSATDAVRTTASLWLLAHTGELRLAGVQVGFAPLGLTALCGYLLYRAGASTGRSAQITDLRGAARASGLLAAAYASIAVAVGVLGEVAAATLAAVAAGSAGVAAAAGGWGVLLAAGLLNTAFARLPTGVRAAVRSGTAAAAALVCAGAVLAGVAFAVDVGTAAELSRGLAPGVVGTAVLLLTCVALAPNAAIYGLSVLAGPGFAVGTGTAVSLSRTSLGAVPAFPLLAALPAEGASSVLRVLLVVPVAAGLLAGVLVARECPPVGARRAALLGGASGLFAALLAGLLAAASGGPVGAGRLAEAGPSPWQVGLAVAVSVGPAAAASAAWLGRRRPGQAG